MGSAPSKTSKIPRLRQSEVQEFSRQTLFTVEEVEMLYKRFYEVSKSEVDDGVIDFSEFCLGLKLPVSPLISDRAFRLFDANGDRVINFREFLLALSTFISKSHETPRTSQGTASSVLASKYRDQVEASFRMYNVKEDDKVYISDIKELLVSAISQVNSFQLSQEQISQIIDSLIKTEMCHEDENGKYIDKNSYKRMVMNDNRVVKWLGIDMERVAHSNRQVVIKKSKSRCLPL
ncbi:unnamed protein product [Blepharisma stoltei]|uniref:EF-hand domain-containing protein n=1 Tax=Blepharisma stoltei TaxID=1481888 RepID=A0AAU9K8X9_9CILI|nr:unnamed protein product [Blepharisma stoltei]